MNLSWLLVEFIGVFAVTFMGAGSICLNEMTDGNLGLIGIAMAHGLTLAVMISAAAPISGGKINPVISIALWIAGKNSFRTAIMERRFKYEVHENV
jgi:glycerol uptake facilitator-like aquaporin